MIQKCDKVVLADVNISRNPNTFNCWTAEYVYIKKMYLVRIHMNPYGLESEYISFSAIEYKINTITL